MYFDMKNTLKNNRNQPTTLQKNHIPNNKRNRNLCTKYKNSEGQHIWMRITIYKHKHNHTKTIEVQTCIESEHPFTSSTLGTRS